MIIELIVLFLIVYFLFKTWGIRKEKYQAPIHKDAITNDNLLLTCFTKTQLDTFKKYHEKANIIRINDGVVFYTPNQYITEIPHLTWNGVFLNNLCVHPKKRNMGIGKKLVLSVIRRAKLEGKDHIILQVNNNNIKAIELYKKCGFHLLSSGMNENGDHISFYIYRI